VLSFKRIIVKKNNTHKQNANTQKNSEERKTLQVPPFDKKNRILIFMSSKIKRKASFFASFTAKKSGAFFTLEASIVLPVIIYFLCAFLWFFAAFKVQTELQEALRTVSYELSEYAYLYEKIRNLPNEEKEHIRLEDSGIERWLVGGITESYVEGRIKQTVGSSSSVWDYIVGGQGGIELKSFLRIPDKDGMIDLILVYEMKNPFLPGIIGRTECIQRSRVRAWTGFGYDTEGEENKDTEIVYITEYGSVYHITKSCTYLDLSIVSLPFVEVPVFYGGREYTECSLCMLDSLETIYVTETGERFHWDLSCRTLRRRIYEVPIENAGGYRPCSRCGKEVAE